MTAVPGGTQLGPVPIGATRRTTTLLVTPRRTWTNGQAVAAIGRDLTREESDEVHTRHERFAFDIDAAGLILPHDSGPTVPEQLRGLSAQRGLRKAVTRLRADRAAGGEGLVGSAGSLTDALLDDIVGTSVASGYGRLYEGSLRQAGGGISSAMRLTCVGFSTMHQHGVQFDVQRYFEKKPPSIEFVPPDPLAWHDDLPMPPDSFRRRRMLQVEPSGDGVVAVTGYFRDTFMRPDGVEMVVHEYGLTATVSGHPLALDSVEAVPGNLPLDHCPMAAVSALGLVGLPLTEVEAAVRRELTGPAGCTHLNDELRSLRLVRALVAPTPA